MPRGKRPPYGGAVESNDQYDYLHDYQCDYLRDYMRFPYGRAEWQSKTAEEKEYPFRRHVDQFLKPHNTAFTFRIGKLPPLEFRDPQNAERYAEMMFEIQGDENPLWL